MKSNIFSKGSRWLRADFHLRTRADREFPYCGTAFIEEYIAALKEAGIAIGVITNHNKFDKDEFKALKKSAKKEDIWLLAGLEFSLKEGIRLLIVFEDKWCQGHEDSINAFIKNAFYGVEAYDTSPYPNSGLDLKGTVEALDKIGLDYFLILPHPDDDNGLFRGLKGRTLESFIKDSSFDKVIALQKSGKKDNYEKLCEYAGRALACVEGSDNAKGGIGALGKGRVAYVKIGAFNFEALRYALTDTSNRVRPKEKPKIENAYIQSIAFTGGLLDTTEIGFSPELNNFIGIRGSGKSAILELLRYALGISLGSRASDRDYKNGLIEHVLRSGGKVVVTLVDERGEEYSVEKTYGQREEVYRGDTRIDVPSIDTVFKRPVYFGQKDLSNKHSDFEADLIKKLIGNKVDAIKDKIAQKSSAIRGVVSKLKEIEDLRERKSEVKGRIADAEHRLKLFEEKGVAQKLKQQNDFDSDLSRIKSIEGELWSFKRDLAELYENYRFFFAESKFVSEENKVIFEQADSIFQELALEFEKVKSQLSNFTRGGEKIRELYRALLKEREALKEQFAAVKRAINLPNLSPDDFLVLNRRLKLSKIELAEIEKSENRKAALQKSLHDEIAVLNQLWYEEYQILREEVSRINEYESSLSISVTYKGRRDQFEKKLQEILKGSGMRTTTYNAIQDRYPDFIEIYKDLSNLGAKLQISPNLIAEFEKRLRDRWEALLTFRVEDEFTIQYNGKALKEHSLGQRATALILFLLAQKETQVLIIDQPEDDLDNQTVYSEVIKQIKALKGQMQFIFATHNPNIPVLGDSEKVISCQYAGSRIQIQAGTLDEPDTQQRIISIMEGGQEAFNRRKRIYNIWDTEKGK